MRKGRRWLAARVPARRHGVTVDNEEVEREVLESAKWRCGVNHTNARARAYRKRGKGSSIQAQVVVIAAGGV